RRWLDHDEFLSALTLCRMLPGPNQVNMAVYVGARYGRLRGALAAGAGLGGGPTAVLAGGGAASLHSPHPPAPAAALRGGAAAAGMTMAMGVKVAAPLIRQPGGVALATAAFVAVHLLRWPLVPVVAVLGPLGVLWAWPRADGTGEPV